MFQSQKCFGTPQGRTNFNVVMIKGILMLIAILAIAIGIFVLALMVGAYIYFFLEDIFAEMSYKARNLNKRK